jgi:hypothetical protein
MPVTNAHPAMIRANVNATIPGITRDRRPTARMNKESQNQTDVSLGWDVTAKVKARMPAAMMKSPKMVKNVPRVKPGKITIMIPKMIPRIPFRKNISSLYIGSRMYRFGEDRQ